MRTARFLRAFVALGVLGALAPAAAHAQFGFLPAAEGFAVRATQEDGSPALTAGSHPYELSARLGFKLAPESPAEPGVAFTDGDVKDIHIDLPPGLVANPTVVPRCTQAQFHAPRVSPFEVSLSGESCPDSTQVGVVTLRTSFGGGSSRSFGIFNLAPPPGAPSQLGFSPFGTPIAITPRVRETGSEFGIRLDLLDFPQQVDTRGFDLTLWGTPWAAGHDGERGNCLDEAEPEAPHGQCAVPFQKANPPRAFLSLPAACEGPLTYRVSANAWQQREPVTTTVLSEDGVGHPQGLRECASLPFNPAPAIRFANERTGVGSGMDFTLDGGGSNLVEPELRVPSQARTAVVALPEGVTVNPSVGAGLGVCTPAQYGAEAMLTEAGTGCPNASKIGEVTVESPLLEGKMEGGLFLAQPDDPSTQASGAENPFDTLLGLYLVARAPSRGVMVKLAGKVALDPASGRLVATFDGLPQLPYNHFNVRLRDGQRGPLATPPTCGTYFAEIDLTAWNDPAPRHFNYPIPILAGASGACPSGARSPFAPQARAGTLNRNAGAYTPFYLHLTRNDEEQEITSYSAELPPGLLGNLSGIPYCSEAAIAAAAGRGGFEELRQPSCPAASSIGHTVSGYGLGSALAYAPGGLYLAGPYHGAPLSIVAIDSATVGPFDLGVIVVRSAIRVDPRTARVSIDTRGSDPIPHIVKGIPLHLRDIRVYVDRPSFTLNPTSCEPATVASILSGSGDSFANPGDDTSFTATNPFQVANCSALGFAPRFDLSVKGGTRRGRYPALKAVLWPRPGDANIGRAVVALPPDLFLAQEHIGTTCTRPQFVTDTCPAASVYGSAEAVTPLLGQPLRGQVYLRSNGGERRLPDLVAALSGDGIQIEVPGRIDSVHGGLRASFEGLPDAPVSSFTMTLYGGKRGLLVNSDNLCTSASLANSLLVGQNNQGVRLRPRVRADCGKKAKRGKHRKSPHKRKPGGARR